MRKKICWVCDGPNWAYHNRAKAMIARMPEHDHYIVFATVSTITRTFDVADIVVVMFLPWLDAIMQLIDNKKIVALMTGHRCFEGD